MSELAGRSAGLDIPAAPPQRELLTAVKGTGALLIGKLFTYVTRLGIAVLVGRLLGADQYGLYTLSLTVALVAGSIGVLGLDVSLVRYVSIYRSRGDSAHLWGTLQLAAFAGGLATIAGLIMFAGSNYLALEVFHDPRLVRVFQVASLMVPFLTLNELLAAATRGFKNMRYTVLAQQFAQPMIRMSLLVILGITIGLSPNLATLCHVIATIATALILLYFLNKQFSLRRPWSEGRRDTREIMIFSLPVYIAGLIKDFGSNIQALLLGSMYAAKSVGIYTAAANFNLIGQIFHASISAASMPILSELHDRQQWPELSRYYKTTAKWTFALNLPMFLVVLLFPKPVLSLFGKGFEGGAGVLIILAWVNVVLTGTGLGGAIIDMTGYSRLKLVNTIGLIAVSVGLNVLLVPTRGMYGAAWAALSANLIVNVARMIEVYVLFRLQPYSWDIVKPIGAALAASMSGWFLFHGLASFGVYPAFIAATAALVATYIVLISLFGLAPDDRVVLDALRRRSAAFLQKTRHRGD